MQKNVERFNVLPIKINSLFETKTPPFDSYK